MSEYLFGCHDGHLVARADRIAAKHGAVHVNYTEPCGRRCGWFSCRNRGEPFDGSVASAVERDIALAGGIEALMSARHRRLK